MRGLSPDPLDRFGSMRAMLDALLVDRRARWRKGLLGAAAACVLGIALGAGTVWMRPGLTDEDRAQITANVDEARAAADRGHFVYPPVEDHDAPTAYRIIRALERIEGPGGALARDQAGDLRREIAGRLVELGDHWDETEGGAAFAADYYATALMFDEENARALERAPITSSQLHTLIARADADAFSEVELVAAQAVVLLAQPERDDLEARVDAVERSKRALPASTASKLRRLVTQKRPSAKIGEDAAAPVVVAEEAEPPAPPESEPAPADPTPAPTPSETAPAPSQTAETLHRRGRSALRAGDRARAIQLFNQTLAQKKKHGGALIGLAEAHFDLGHNHQAVDNAKKAVRAAPRNAGYRLKLGTYLMKVKDYAGARRELEHAKRLGHPRAASRLAALEDLAGG